MVSATTMFVALVLIGGCFFLWRLFSLRRQELAIRQFDAALLAVIEEQLGEKFNLERLLESLISLMGDALPYTAAAYLVVPGKKQLAFGGVAEEEVSREFMATLKTLSIQSLSAMLNQNVSDWTIEEHTVGNLTVRSLVEPVASYMHVPVVLFGEIVGVLTVASQEKHQYQLKAVQPFYEALERFFSAVSRIQGGRSKEDAYHVKMEKEFQRRIYQTEVLKELSERIGYSLDLAKIIEIITGSVGQLLEYHVIAYVVRAQEKVVFKCDIEETVNHQFVDDIKAKMLESFSLLQGVPIKPDEIDESISGSILSEEVKDPVRSFFNLPLIINGKAVGLITVASTKENLYNEEETAVLYTIANQASTAVTRLNEVLEREKGKLNSLVTSLNDGIIMFDPHWSPIVVNTQARALLGLSGEAIGLYDVLDKLSGKIDIRTQVERAQQTNTEVPVSVVTLGDKTVQIVILRVKDHEGEHLGSVVVLHDITKETETRRFIEQKAAELEAANVRIEEQRDRAESILRYLRSIGEGVFATDVEGKVIFMNDAAEVMSGQTFATAQGNAYKSTFIFQDETGVTQTNDLLAMVLSQGAKIDLPEKIFLLSGEKRIPVTGTSAPILDERGAIQGSITVFQDITKKRELEQMKERFLTVAAHQLRTPLGSIRWGIELLESGDFGDLPEAAQDVVKQLKENSARIVSIVDDLLKVSSDTAGTMVVPPEAVDMVAVVKAVVAASTEAATQKQIRFEMVMPKKSPRPVLFVPSRLKEVVGHLISNALRYGREQGIVKIGITEQKAWLILKITDTGIGIPEDEQSKIFSKFFRASNAVRYFTDASGLGLSVVKSFVEEGGGEISFESQENVGTTFTVKLPLVKS